MKGAAALASLLTVLPVASATAGVPPVPVKAASVVFARAHALCSADGGRLWGVTLCGPLMLADPLTHAAIANVPVPGAKRVDVYYRFTLPADAQIANAPFQYGGIRWAQVTWPLAGSADEQAVTLMHESFHRIQPKLGFIFEGARYNAVSISGSPALDTETGRIWLRGEMHALRVSLTSHGAARKKALTDALALRAYRDAILPSTAASEHVLDIMEGLAESTGIDIGVPPARRLAYTLHDMAFAEGASSYARNFFYAIGPAYAELLDALNPNWRRSVTTTTSIAALAARAYGIADRMPSAARARAILARYGGAEIERTEAARAARQAARDAKYRAELVTGPTLRLPMKKFKIDFNPSAVEALGGYGSVYHHVTVSAPWGTIVVSHGDAMIAGDFTMLTVATPSSLVGSTLHGIGWVLTLTPKTKIVADPKKRGSYTVTQ